VEGQEDRARRHAVLILAGAHHAAAALDHHGIVILQVDGGGVFGVDLGVAARLAPGQRSLRRVIVPGVVVVEHAPGGQDQRVFGVGLLGRVDRLNRR
jgi:hypothetical protein